MDSTFIGVDIASGKKPFTVATLDRSLNSVSLFRMDMKSVYELLKNTSEAIVAVNMAHSATARKIRAEFCRQLGKLGFKADGKQGAPRHWFDINANECYRDLIRKNPLSKHTIEGRIQRGLILFEHDLRIDDPMDFFEETTRHRMMMGEFPNEMVYSAAELDALMGAYMALKSDKPE